MNDETDKTPPVKPAASHIRQSIPMAPANWEQLDKVADGMNATFAGRPSWRVLLRLIAEGEIICSPRMPRAKRKRGTTE